MAGLLHDNEIQTELNQWRALRNTPGTRWKLHLFTNPAPALSDDFDCTTLTEPTFAGYAAAFVSGWGVPVESGEPAVWITTATGVKFCRTDTGACQTVYGWFATREEDGLCAAMELAWPSGLQFCNACDCYLVTPSKGEQDVTPGD